MFFPIESDFCIVALVVILLIHTQLVLLWSHAGPFTGPSKMQILSIFVWIFKSTLYTSVLYFSDLELSPYKKKNLPQIMLFHCLKETHSGVIP